MHPRVSADSTVQYIHFYLIQVALCVFGCRRNLPGDRQKALDIMLPLVEGEEQVASDMYCLVGRIYKDMFLESHFTDTQSRDSGTQW